MAPQTIAQTISRARQQIDAGDYDEMRSSCRLTPARLLYGAEALEQKAAQRRRVVKFMERNGIDTISPGDAARIA